MFFFTDCSVLSNYRVHLWIPIWNTALSFQRWCSVALTCSRNSKCSSPMWKTHLTFVSGRVAQVAQALACCKEKLCGLHRFGQAIIWATQGGWWLTKIKSPRRVQNPSGFKGNKAMSRHVINGHRVGRLIWALSAQKRKFASWIIP